MLGIFFGRCPKYILPVPHLFLLISFHRVGFETSIEMPRMLFGRRPRVPPPPTNTPPIEPGSETNSTFKELHQACKGGLFYIKFRMRTRVKIKQKWRLETDFEIRGMPSRRTECTLAILRQPLEPGSKTSPNARNVFWPPPKIYPHNSQLSTTQLKASKLPCNSILGPGGDGQMTSQVFWQQDTRARAAASLTEGTHAFRQAS